MAISASGDRCLLCGSALDADDLAMHLRLVHEVIAGERTVVDVPERAPNQLNAGPHTARPENVLVGAGT